MDHVQPAINLARNKPVRASSFSNPYVPRLAVNGIGSEASRWLPRLGMASPHWLEVDLLEREEVGSVMLYFWRTGSPDDSVRFELQMEDEGRWLPIAGTAYSREYLEPIHLIFAEPVQARRFRIVFQDAFLSLVELQLYPPGHTPEPLAFLDEPALEQVVKNADYDPDVRVLVSQLGYHPEHRKQVVYLFGGTAAADTFEVLRADSGEAVFTGALTIVEDDFGIVQVGDFSEWTGEGEYRVRIGTDYSFRTFHIREHLWGEYQKLIALQYFGARRVGEDSVVGDYGDTMAVRWDDARTADGQYRYIGKGFADGDDLRRFCNASLIVAQYCLLKRTDPFWDTGDWIYEQVRWGLDGVLSFLGKDGLLRHGLHIRTPDIHYGTDGRFESGDEGLLIDPIHDEEENAYEYSTLNEEVIHTSLLIGPAEACLLYGERDPEFFERVKQLVIRGYRSIEQRFSPYPAKYSLSAWMWLNALMHELTGEALYKERAMEEAGRFMQLQVKDWHGDGILNARGWYRYTGSPDNDPWIGITPRYGKYSSLDSETRSPWGEKPEQEIMIVPWLYQGLFRMLDLFGDEEIEAGKQWRASIESYARDYLLAISKQNVYGLTPMKVGSAGLIRQKGTLSYQYHGEIGRMFHQLANGALLMKAGRLLGDRELLDAAWNHAYYFTGCNPLGIGAIYGLSGNIPSQQYKADTVGKAYPGAVCNGFNCISGSNDHAQFQYWEFYGYANLASLWFATEIGSRRFAGELELWPSEITEALHSASPEEHRRHTLPVRVKSGFTYRFAALPGNTEAEEQDLRQLEWLVNDTVGGNVHIGTVSPDGVYTAPYVEEERVVVVGVRYIDNLSVRAATEVTVMPAPHQAVQLSGRTDGQGTILEWIPVTGNVTGYTIWSRQSVSEQSVGTIFERIGFIELPEASSYEVKDNPLPGTEYLVKAYHRQGDKNYGFGPESNIVTV
ncbi:cellulase N-terminal Ig-like domain-containing protein [Paenibacillus puerhi]|uniref:cellulase N-terminal Ig-like domain-containing protein n=1 Tax=Paenibacillus puerhi TaxID=2692622 RepID=UPI00135A0191|nr:cellulase N-terminal Ig-like domain-containing protein [Paenibacillus puerhi]